ncbi:MAG: nitroreductase family protein [Candidatus Acidifodinimicrobium sp.]
MNAAQEQQFSCLRNLIKTRRAIREFTEIPIPEEDIRDIIEAAIWAPSASNMNAREFVAVRDKGNIRKIKAFSPGMFTDPAYIIVLCTNEQKALEVGGELGRDKASLMDIAVSTQNILLSAWAKGIGSCPLASFNSTAISKILHLPSHIRPDLLITMGYPARVPETPERPKIDEVTFYEQYGRTEIKK